MGISVLAELVLHMLPLPPNGDTNSKNLKSDPGAQLI